MIKIFIATCLKNKKAEIALEYSIRKHTSSDIEIHWMRNGDNQIGWNEIGWGTSFTPFRWLIPKLCNFEGKAIYLDVDIILMSDIEELWELDLKDKAVMSLPGNYSVMLMDCAKFKPFDFDLDKFKQRSCSPPFSGMVNDIIKAIEENNLVRPLPDEWNCLDGQNIDWTKAKLIHFTKKSTQPWKPYPDRHTYHQHQIPELQKTWEEIFKEATTCG